MPNVEIVNEMRGRFIWRMQGSSRDLVIRGVLTTCNFGPDENGRHCYNGPFTHVVITRFSGSFLRMRVGQVVGFEAIPEGRY